MAINAVSKVARNRKYLNFARTEITSEVNDSIIPEHSMGTMSYICSRCDARFWECEKLSTSTKASIKFSLCCGGGKVVLSPFGTPPEFLTHLLTATDNSGREFRSHIRAYNSSLALCSLGANYDRELANARRGVYTFRIHGVVYHLIGGLAPRDGKPPAFAQINIHDGTPENELENRQLHLGQACHSEQLLALQMILHEVNPYVKYFKHAMNLMRTSGGLDVRMRIRADGCPDPRRYAAPTAPEIAVLLLGDGQSEGLVVSKGSLRHTVRMTHFIMSCYFL